VRENQIEKRKKELHKITDQHGYQITSLDITIIKSYSPREFYIGMDIQAKKKMPM